MSMETLSHPVQLIDKTAEPCVTLLFETRLSNIETFDKTRDRYTIWIENHIQNASDVQICIVCDICKRETLYEQDVVRILCKYCKQVYDYCKDHEMPKECLFCFK